MAKILIVEDEPDIAAVEKAILGKGGYNVDIALGGAEGIRKIKTKKDDLILLDIRMPEVSGRDILEFMKKSKIETPVIVVTAVAATMDVRNELEAKYGIDGFVAKTYINTDLIKEVKRVLSLKK
jgi:CheY-like chemotaxis protein